MFITTTCQAGRVWIEKKIEIGSSKRGNFSAVSGRTGQLKDIHMILKSLPMRH